MVTCAHVRGAIAHQGLESSVSVRRCSPRGRREAKHDLGNALLAIELGVGFLATTNDEADRAHLTRQLQQEIALVRELTANLSIVSQADQEILLGGRS